MSDNHNPSAMQSMLRLRLAQSLSVTEQHIITSCLQLLPEEKIQLNADVSLQQNIVAVDDNNDNTQLILIKKIVDGRGLACPMPLLKTKVALRDIAVNESLYVIATDPNSQNDIAAFCQQNQQNTTSAALQLTINQMTPDIANTSTASSDTIYHFIITKTGSN